MFKKLNEVVVRYNEIDLKLQDPETVKDKKNYTKLLKEYSQIESIVTLYKEYQKIQEQLDSNKKLLKQEADKELKELIKEELEKLEERFLFLELELKKSLIPKNPNDEKNVIVEIRAGAGGDESSLFAQDLFRAYSLFSSDKKWSLEILSSSLGNAGGFKEIICSISGDKVFSILKYESGVHRVQRVPDTETRGRVHTSTVTVVVLPEADDVDIEVQAKDLRIDVYRSSGNGGQSVNTTDSAVRITHIPTGLVVTCQDGKSQTSNKQKALKVLYSRLHDMKVKEQQEQASQSRLAQVGTGDRSERIRTYNFPQSRITDHRIGFTTHQMSDFLSGKINLLTDPLVTYFQTEALKQNRV